TLKRRNSSDGPRADQASLRVALDLYGKKQHLQQDHAGEQDQRSMTRRNGDHKKLTVISSKLIVQRQKPWLAREAGAGQKNASAGKDNSAVADIRGKLRRRALERHADGVHDRGHAFA